MFKAGDKVVCVDPGASGVFELNKEYTIKEIVNLRRVRIVETRDAFGGGGWMVKRFKHVEKEAVVAAVKDKYVGLTAEQLYAHAMEMNLPGRGRMNKAELLAALRAIMPDDKPKAAPAVPKVDEFKLGRELRQKTGNNPGVCSYVIRCGDIVTWNIKDVCHARFRGPYREQHKGINEAVLDVAGHYNEHTYKEGYRAFLDYMLNRSPYSSTFKTKSVEQALETGVYSNADGASHSRCVAGAIGLREGSEYPKRMVVFMEVKKMGFSEHVAHIATQFLLKDGSDFKLTYPNGGHMSTVSSMERGDYLKFYKVGFHRHPDQKVMSAGDAYQYQIYDSIAAQGGKDNIETMMTGLFKTVIRKGWEVKPNVLTQRALYAGLEALEKAIEDVKP